MEEEEEEEEEERVHVPIRHLEQFRPMYLGAMNMQMDHKTNETTASYPIHHCDALVKDETRIQHSACVCVCVCVCVWYT